MSEIKALDGFERYYSEKLWESIPEIYRHEDGLSDPPGMLRALVNIIAQQAAVLRRSQDRLWEDQFIEWCNNWAVPYLGELVGTRMVSDLISRRRVDVAKTIYYRRRKGTLTVLEQLISDIAGWEGKVVEAFRHLARARHGLDPEPMPYAGRYSGTMPGGCADIRRPLAARFVGTAFDEYYYTPDVRRHRGHDGRKNIPNLEFHLFRLAARALVGVTPFKRSPATYTFDPSGRDVVLFNARRRQTPQAATQVRDWNAWQSAQVWELPLPIPCLVLGHAEYQMGDALIANVVTMANQAAAVPQAVAFLGDELLTLRGRRFVSEERLHLTLRQLPSGTELTSLNNWDDIWQVILAGALVKDCGNYQLIPKALEVIEVPVQGAPALSLSPVQVAVGNLSDWSIDLPDKPEKLSVVDPERGRLKFIGKVNNDDHKPKKVGVSYHYAFPGRLGAGAYERQADLVTGVTSNISGGGTLRQSKLTKVAQIQDSMTYCPVRNPANLTDLVVQAADGQRPYLCLRSDWVFDSRVAGACLTLEGLWVGSHNQCDVVLKGDFKCVTIRHCTLDPGGENCKGERIFPVHLFVEGHIDKLIIDSSILGPVAVRRPAAPQKAATGLVEKLEIRDSILQQLDAGKDALYMELGEAVIERSTILGSTMLHRLTASELLAAGHVNVIDTQKGCFRFGAVFNGSRLPHPYESHILYDVDALFTTTRFGDWGYFQLAETAPDFVRSGAENGSEMGAFSSCFNPIKLKSLRSKVEEYMPFGLLPVYIPEV